MQEVRESFLVSSPHPSLLPLGRPSLSKSLSSFLLQVFPPAPVRPAYSFYNRHQELASLLPRLDKPCPAYVEPMTGKRVLGREQEQQQAAVSDLSPSVLQWFVTWRAAGSGLRTQRLCSGSALPSSCAWQRC